MATTNPGANEGAGQPGAQPGKGAKAQPQGQQAQQQAQGERGAATATGGGRQGAGMVRRGTTAAGLGGFGPIGLSPFSFLRRMIEDLDRMFDEFGGAGGRELLRGPFPGGDVMWMPQMEVLERDGNLVVRADLPGLRKEDVRIQVMDDALVIEGERRREVEEERGGAYRSEVVYGSFRRAIPLPEGVKAEDAEARFENGVLEIRVPLPKEARRGRRIEIKGGEGPAVH
jgi:HSP20 family protein